MFRSTKFVEFLASEWHMETPKEIRRKKHLFTAGKGPNPEKRITNILPFLERNGVKATASNVIQIINLCEHATKEVRVKFCGKSRPEALPARRETWRLRRCGWPHSSTTWRGSMHSTSSPRSTTGAAASSQTRTTRGRATPTSEGPSRLYLLA